MQVRQSGGVDPGLAALIASLLSGGIGSYGYAKQSNALTQSTEAAIKQKYETQLSAAEDKASKAAFIEQEKATREQRIKDLEAELATVKQERDKAKQSASATSGPASAFKNASPAVLKRAAAIMIEELKGRFPDTDASRKKLLDALLYPATYTGRFARMSLLDFYTKRVAPASRGGRRRRRRGGYDPPSGLGFPGYDEFAKLYAEAIEKASRDLASDASQAKATAAQSKKDQTAVKAAGVLADKIKKAVESAEKDATKHVDLESLIEIKDSLKKTIEEAKVFYEESPDAQEKSLRLVKTEADWKSKEPEAKAALARLQEKVKDFTQYVSKAKKVPITTEPPLTAFGSEPDASIRTGPSGVSTTSTNPRRLSEGELEEGMQRVENPLVLQARREQSRKEQQDALLAEGPQRLTQRAKKKVFGGRNKVRKSTFKRRRGGK